VIRKYRPTIVLANAIRDRHPDHGRAASLSYDSCFLAGLAKITTKDRDGNLQDPWRPEAVYHYIQSQYIAPDLVVDVSDFWEVKMKAVMAYKSQMYDPSSKEPQTFISTPEFLKLIESRAVEYGHAIGVKYAEGFTARRYIGVRDLFDLI
jgi:bacillithiol biosynthesis deacetylase BshB1